MSRALYTLAWLLALPLVLLRLLWRARQQPGYLAHLGERLGLHAWRRDPAPLIWIHAVSVGETRAAAPLVAALRRRWPDHRLLFTHMTPTGRDTAAQLYAGQAASAWLPWDLPWCQRSFLRRQRPVLGLVMETELWPNLVAACRTRGLPLLLVNGRLSARSAARYARLPALAGPMLASLAGLGAQTQSDAVRFAELGALHPTVTGNLKFDIEVPPAQLDLARHFRARIGHRQVLLIASSREGEEALLLPALHALLPESCLIVVVPRHPQRFDELARELGGKLRLQRRSDNQPVATDTRLWLGDSMGELFAYYAACDLAVIGGSWLPLGGQNLIEACAVGRPVLVGPHTFNFAQATEDALAAGAARRCADAPALADTATRLLADHDTLVAMGVAGRRYATAHRGATERSLALIAPLLGDGVA